MPLTPTATLLVACATAALVGCLPRSEADLLKSAGSDLSSGDHRAAIVRLKTVLQANQQSAEARYLLGQALLDSGDSAAALIELEKARDLKFDDERLPVAAARALVGQRKLKEVQERFSATTLTDPQRNAELRSTLALAHTMQGRITSAEGDVDKALASVPGHPEAVMVRARIRAGLGEIDAALAMVDGVIASNTNLEQAWLARGDILLEARQDARGAMDAYKKVLDLRPDSAAAHSGLMFALMSQNDLTAATTQHAQMAKVLPADAMTRFFAAQLAFHRRDYATARDMVQQLMQSNADDPRLLQLAGMIAIEQHAWVQAQTYLTKALLVAANPRFVTVLLARAYASAGQPDKALELLQPLVKERGADGAALALAAEVHLQTGDLIKAADHFQRAAELLPNDTKVQTGAALAKMTRGDVQGSFSQLEKVAATSTDDFADQALISARLVRNELQLALLAIDALEKKTPSKPLPAYLRGRVLLMQGDVPSARVSFERAMAIDKQSFTPVSALAGLDLKANDRNSARKRLEAFLQIAPGNAQATVALARLLALDPATVDQAVKSVQAVVVMNSNEPSLRLWLVDHYLAVRNFKQALSVAQDAAAALPDDPTVLDALGRAQLSSGDANQAVGTFTKLATMLPQSAEPLLRLSDAHVARRQYAAAIQDLRRAIELSPNLLTAYRGLLNLERSTSGNDRASALARSMQNKSDPDLAQVGYSFEGDIELSSGRFDVAAGLYRKALQRGGTLPEVATKLHVALVRANKQREADAFVNTWLAANPGDTQFLAYLGHRSLAARDHEQALIHLTKLVELTPDDARALNNLAWVKLALKQPGALALAERADALTPNVPTIMDTLARALANSDRLADAVEVQRKALTLAPNDNASKLGLATLLARSGDSAGARKVLAEMTPLPKGHPVANEASALAEKLGKS